MSRELGSETVLGQRHMIEPLEGKQHQLYLYFYHYNKVSVTFCGTAHVRTLGPGHFSAAVQHHHLLMTCSPTKKLHTTPLLRPALKPFPLRTMSKDSGM